MHHDQLQFRMNSSWDLEAIDTGRHTRDISQISVENKYSKAPNSGKAILFTTTRQECHATRTEKQPGNEKRTLSKSQ